VVAVQEMNDAARSINPNVLVLCHGGPIAVPEDVTYGLALTRGFDGFFGASSMERLPVEVAIAETTTRFKAISVPA
jgi:predicted TIM-barrel enzyme